MLSVSKKGKYAVNWFDSQPFFIWQNIEWLFNLPDITQEWSFMKSFKMVYYSNSKRGWEASFEQQCCYNTYDDDIKPANIQILFEINF